MVPWNLSGCICIFYKRLMLSCVQSCISNPDRSYICKKQRMCFEKSFQQSVGFKSGGRRDSHCIRVVCLRLKSQWIVIAAFPIWRIERQQKCMWLYIIFFFSLSLPLSLYHSRCIYKLVTYIWSFARSTWIMCHAVQRWYIPNETVYHVHQFVFRWLTVMQDSCVLLFFVTTWLLKYIKASSQKITHAWKRVLTNILSWLKRKHISKGRV